MKSTNQQLQESPTRITDTDGDLTSITATGNIDCISNDADLSGELTANLPTGSAGQKMPLDVVINGVKFTAIAEWNISKFNDDDWIVNDIRTTEPNADFLDALVIDYEDPEHAIAPTLEFNLSDIQVKPSIRLAIIKVQADLHHVNHEYSSNHMEQLNASVAMLAQANGLQS